MPAAAPAIFHFFGNTQVVRAQGVLIEFIEDSLIDRLGNSACDGVTTKRNQSRRKSHP
jgi:hypothetical protein